MLWVYRSNRVEKLTQSLSDLLSQPGPGPMSLEWVGVSGIGMRNYLEREIARSMGIAAGSKFPFPKEILDVICLDNGVSVSPFDEGVLTWSIYDLLPELSAMEAFSRIRQYLMKDASDAKRLGLARKVAHTFSEYALFRPQMVLGWETGTEEDWQAVLWRSLVHRHGAVHIARAAADFLMNPEARLRKLPFRRLSFFCVPTFSPLYVSVLSAVSKFMDVYLFMLSPSAEWWADLGFSEDAAALHHPLLTSLGRTGSDFQWLLEENGSYLEPVGDLHEAPTHGGTSMLRLLQSDMLNLRSPARDAHKFRDDRTVQVHACPGPLRELEVVKEQLLEFFASDIPGLTPDEIAVFAPDIHTFEPFIHAVFGSDIHPMPFNVAGKGSGGSLVASPFTRLLDLPSGRLTVRDVFDFLAADSVRRKFGLSAGDVMELKTWVSDAGVRWGADRTHRETAEQPSFEENTWRFGIDRILLSLAFDADEGGIFAGKSACRGLRRDDRVLLASLLRFLQTLFEVVEAMRSAQTPTEWTVLLQSAMSQLFIRDAQTDGEWTAVYRSLQSWCDDCALGGYGDPISLSAVRKFLNDAVENAFERKEWRPYGITFADIRTFRAVPFRVICLVGLNESVYPKQYRAPDFDKTAQRPMRGDRSSLDDDRFQFLEAVLSARDALVLTYSGRNPQDGSVLFPSSPVAELLNCVQRNFGLEEGSFVLQHPVSPFSPNYFGRAADHRLFSRDAAALQGARAIEGHASPEKQFFHGPLLQESSEKQPEKQPEKQIDISSLIYFFSSPHRMLLSERVGIRFPWIPGTPPEREPMSGSTDNRQLERFVLSRLHDDGDLSDLEAAARSLGVLPLGAAGRVRFRRIYERALSFFERVNALGLGERLPDKSLDLAVHGPFGNVRLVGEIEGIRERCLTGLALSKFERLSTLPALHLFQSAASMSGDSDTAVLIEFYADEQKITSLASPKNPSAYLSDLIELYLVGMTQPLPYFPEISCQFVQDRLRGKPLDVALKNARAGWRDMDPIFNSAALTAFRGRDPFDASFLPSLTFESISMRVFSSIMDALARGDS